MQKLPIKPNANIVNLGNFENIVEMKDQSVSFGKRKSLDIYDNGFWIQLDDKLYYFKTIKTITRLINDLLGVKITEYFELPSVQYKIAKGFYNGEEIYGLISKYQRNKEYKYSNLYDLAYSEDSPITEPYDIRNLSFLKSLESAYSGTILPNQLKKLIVRDFVTNEKDRKMSEIHIREKNNIIEIDKIFDYEIEWNLVGEANTTDIDDIEINKEDINLDYKIPGLLSLTKKDLSYIQNDPIFQKNLLKFMDMEVASMLEQIELENKIVLTQSDYDYYSLYAETVKSKIKSEKFLI